MADDERPARTPNPTPANEGPGAKPDMTRERARTERRDLDKERGEPVAGGVAGGVARGGPRALHPMAHTRVVAPETNQSAAAHQMTIMRPIRVGERTLGDGSLGYSVDGSPTDAVSLAFLGYFGHGFDLVAAGINYGANLGDDITYSGTVSAAMESVINGCPAFAISQEYYEHPDFALATVAAAIVARNILEHGLSRGELVNVNVPAATIEECEGIEITRLGRRVYQDQLVERLDPRGIPYFWIGGPPPSGLAIEGTDFHAVINRRIAITPIHLDLTGRRLLRRLSTWAWPTPAEFAARMPGADAAPPPPGPEEPAASAVEARIGDEKRVERR
jgi:5'-nucleotidase